MSFVLQNCPIRVFLYSLDRTFWLNFFFSTSPKLIFKCFMTIWGVNTTTKSSWQITNGGVKKPFNWWSIIFNSTSMIWAYLSCSEQSHHLTVLWPLTCISRYNLDTENSDMDMFVIYQSETKALLCFDKEPPQTVKVSQFMCLCNIKYKQARVMLLLTFVF